MDIHWKGCSVIFLTFHPTHFSLDSSVIFWTLNINLQTGPVFASIQTEVFLHARFPHAK